jgi:hypothetical protein
MVKKKTKTTTAAPNGMYFTEIHEAAIVEYNNSDDYEYREELFRHTIDPALDKMAESIINRFKFPYIDMPFEDIKRQVVSFLICNLHKFDPDRGNKAFSYFSVMAKNHLILLNTVAYKQERTNVSLSLDDAGGIEAPDATENDDAKEFIRLMIRYWDKNLTRVFKKKRDIDIATAIIQLFRDVDGIENFNKKALYVMIREMTDCETNYITKVINKMRYYAVQHMNEFHEYGTIGSQETDYFSYED